MTEPSTRFPPFPDRLMVPAAKDLTIAWLRGLQLPERYASRALREWAAYVGVTLTELDYHGLHGGAEPPLPEE